MALGVELRMRDLGRRTLDRRPHPRPIELGELVEQRADERLHGAEWSGVRPHAAIKPEYACRRYRASLTRCFRRCATGARLARGRLVTSLVPCGGSLGSARGSPPCGPIEATPTPSPRRAASGNGWPSSTA